jgi:hypothetical protein
MRTDVSFYAGFVTDFVKVICGNTRLDFCSDNVQDFAS